MHVKARRYRDVRVAPGSQMFAALESGDEKLAKRIYEQCIDDERELMKRAEVRLTQEQACN